jgi:hypothetical protein
MDRNEHLKKKGAGVVASHMRSRALLIFALALFIAGCVIVPETCHVIRSPHTLEKVEGVRPKLFIKHKPNDYRNRLIQLNLPGQRLFCIFRVIHSDIQILT